jgi:hypothetical protein
MASGAGKLGQDALVIPCMMGGGIRLGIKLDAISAGRMGGVDGSRLGIDEERNAACVSLSRGDQRCDTSGVPRGIAVIGGLLADCIRHKGRLVRTNGPYMIEQIVFRVTFDVVFGTRVAAHEFGKWGYVIGTDMALVGARVYGDAVRPGL